MVNDVMSFIVFHFALESIDMFGVIEQMKMRNVLDIGFLFYFINFFFVQVLLCVFVLGKFEQVYVSVWNRTVFHVCQYEVFLHAISLFLSYIILVRFYLLICLLF